MKVVKGEDTSLFLQPPRVYEDLVVLYLNLEKGVAAGMEEQFHITFSTDMEAITALRNALLYSRMEGKACLLILGMECSLSLFFVFCNNHAPLSHDRLSGRVG